MFAGSWHGRNTENAAATAYDGWFRRKGEGGVGNEVAEVEIGGDLNEGRE
jgi:hypothetical protein